MVPKVELSDLFTMKKKVQDMEIYLKKILYIVMNCMIILNHFFHEYLGLLQYQFHVPNDTVRVVPAVLSSVDKY